eukprot:COSAG05_NODE_2054_length_3633_cov_4.249010_3_plen_252_part_00
MVKVVDADGSGEIDFPEFLTMMAKNYNENADEEEDLRQAFKVFTPEGMAFINVKDLKRGMTNLGENITDEEVNEMLSEADQDADGVLDVTEFVNMMRNLRKESRQLKNGDSYKGQVANDDDYDDANDQMEGRGVYTWANGDVYDGQYKNDERHGKGTWTSASGERYEGMWEHDKRHGPGKYWPSPPYKIYTGVAKVSSFRASLRGGASFRGNAPGVQVGLWEQGEFVGKGKKSKGGCCGGRPVPKASDAQP